MADILELLPCQDSPETSERVRRLLDIDRTRAAHLGQTAVETVQRGYWINRSGVRVDLAAMIEAALIAKRSIRPEDALPPPPEPLATPARVQVCNETTLEAARRLAGAGSRPLALNFANGIHPGGGFLGGARAQEEVLCRSSALWSTLVGDTMYGHHAQRPLPDSTDWVILSPDVPVFRSDDGADLDEPWLLSFVTCAAPVAFRVGVSASAELMRRRIRRVLCVARAWRYRSLVLGAWGCGAFHNDPGSVARSFRSTLEGELAGAFDEVVFAITDWSPERKFLGPFRDVFSAP